MEDPKYKIGQFAIVRNWGGKTEPLEILHIKRVVHRRMNEDVWGYKMNGYTGLTMDYIPEGYLEPTNP